MSLLDVFSGKQSLGQWLTGRSPDESYICQNTDKVEDVINTINTISTDNLTTAKDEIYAAFEQLNSVPGVAEYIGTFEPAQYNEYFEYIKEAIANLSNTMDQNSQNIIAYDQAGFGTKFAATLGMILAKPVEGVLSVVEDFGDGVLSVVGFVSGAIPFIGKDIQKGISSVVQAEWSHDIMQYDKWAKYSAITEDSAIGNGLRIGGKIAGYVAGGYLMAGAMGLSTTATYGTGLLKASGATWGGTAFAGITGIGSGTEEGLNLGLDYNKAFGHGVGQGAKQAAVAFAVGSTFDRISAAKAAKGAKEGGDDIVGNGVKEGGDDAVAGGSKETTKLLPGKVAGESADEVAGGTAKEAAKDAATSSAEASAKEAAKDAAEEGAKKGLRDRVSEKLGNTVSGAKQKASELAGKAGNLAGNVKKPFQYVAQNGGAKGIAANGGLTLSAIGAQSAGGIASEVSGAITSEIHDQRIKPELDTYNNLKDLAEKVSNGNPIVDGFTPADGSKIDDTPAPTPVPPTTDDGGGGNQTPVSPTPVSPGGGSNNGGGGYTPSPTPGTSGGGQTPDTGGGKTPDTDGGKTPDTDGGKTPDTDGGKTPDTGGGQVPDTGKTIIVPGTNGDSSYVVRPSEPSPAANPGGSYYTPTATEPTHSGAEYNGNDVELDSLELENADALEDLEDIEDTSSSIDNIINNNPNKNRIPTTPAPINTNNKSSGSVVPIAVGLSVAAAAGLGAKAYMDHKRNNEMNDDEYEEEEYDDFESEDWNGDENTVELDYSEANPTDSEQYLEEDNFYQDEDSGYSARNASELAELQ